MSQSELPERASLEVDLRRNSSIAPFMESLREW